MNTSAKSSFSLRVGFGDESGHVFDVSFVIKDETLGHEVLLKLVTIAKTVQEAADRESAADIAREGA